MFDTPAAVEQVCYDLKLADFPRGNNRARINNLFNGMPPYSQEEVEANGIAINVNDLSSTRLGHDARAQLYSAIMKPGNFFHAKSNYGPKHKRKRWSDIVTNEANRIMKRSLPYFECLRSKVALSVLHGVGPGNWDNRDSWRPKPRGIEDILVPSNIEIPDMNEQMPFFAIYRSYTAPQLIRLTRGPKVDPGWNVPLVNRCIKWIEEQAAALMGTNWPEIWSPEKTAEIVKGDTGFYAADQVPTIDVFDFYFWNEEDKRAGWNRRMILDSWSTPEGTGKDLRMSWKAGKELNGRDSFVFDPGKRKYADKLSQIVNFQFADLSAVAPFRYHSVRSLGFMIYAVCHLENRLRCKFNEAVFESLMMYLRVKSMDDVQRALKIELISRGFIDETVNFVPQSERWEVNTQLAELGLQENSRLIERNSSAYTQNLMQTQDRTEKTKFQVMAEVNAMNQLVAPALLQAYRYQEVEYQEIFRRFCRKTSSDIEVKQFRAACLRQGVPEEALVAEAWDIEAERVIGNGNKTMEMAISQQLLEMRNLYDPEAQREILHDVTLALVDDPARADRLVPDEPVHVTDSVHDAQLVAGTLMQGLPVALKTGMNHIEYIETLMLTLQLIVAKAQKAGGVATMDKIEGMSRIAQHIGEHIQVLAQDDKEKPRVKQYQDQLAKIMNLVKAMAQRAQEAAQKQNGQAQMDPKDAAKIQATMLMAKAKAQNTRESHAQRTVQRQIQFEQKLKQDEQKHAADIQKTDLEAAADISRNRLKSLGE